MRRLVVGCALAVACASQPQKPQTTTAAATPPELGVPAGAELLYDGKAAGAQVYSCAAKADGGGYEWKLKAPEAGCDADHGGAEVRSSYAAVYRMWGDKE